MGKKPWVNDTYSHTLHLSINEIIDLLVIVRPFPLLFLFFVVGLDEDLGLVMKLARLVLGWFFIDGHLLLNSRGITNHFYLRLGLVGASWLGEWVGVLWLLHHLHLDIQLLLVNCSLHSEDCVENLELSGFGQLLDDPLCKDFDYLNVLVYGAIVAVGKSDLREDWIQLAEGDTQLLGVITHL